MGEDYLNKNVIIQGTIIKIEDFQYIDDSTGIAECKIYNFDQELQKQDFQLGQHVQLQGQYEEKTFLNSIIDQVKVHRIQKIKDHDQIMKFVLHTIYNQKNSQMIQQFQNKQKQQIENKNTKQNQEDVDTLNHQYLIYSQKKKQIEQQYQEKEKTIQTKKFYKNQNNFNYQADYLKQKTHELKQNKEQFLQKISNNQKILNKIIQKIEDQNKKDLTCLLIKFLYNLSYQQNLKFSAQQLSQNEQIQAFFNSKLNIHTQTQQQLQQEQLQQQQSLQEQCLIQESSNNRYSILE
ncbi:hypothetical protein PPERSA_04744 [Pseudocohnilembus persalinus]|uniref:Nucleic acid-binding, OB-fold n=1 Tax=Pseudocohnilembus persalinus TaxID=266149 RepID=A0A0V0QP66_PSEPJ|nr:hypothetical protein PPERSA_04744 [Pseudocohnilembus persalinus]|eukprot:KRX03866.1 hypothetical protein PPERSA_04744 [Pseudocohnilembus persalinus]